MELPYGGKPEPKFEWQVTTGTTTQDGKQKHFFRVTLLISGTPYKTADIPRKNVEKASIRHIKKIEKKIQERKAVILATYYLCKNQSGVA